MLVAVVSDTHGVSEYIKKVANVITKADILIHLGDNISDLDELKIKFTGTVYGVKGNCDFENSIPKELLIDIEGKKILITHGDRYNVKAGINTLYYSALEKKVDVALFGHSHIPLIVEQDGVLFVNPGSPSLPRLNARTIAFLEVNKDKPVSAYLYEIRVWIKS